MTATSSHVAYWLPVPAAVRDVPPPADYAWTPLAALLSGSVPCEEHLDEMLDETAVDAILKAVGAARPAVSSRPPKEDRKPVKLSSCLMAAWSPLATRDSQLLEVLGVRATVDASLPLPEAVAACAAAQEMHDGCSVLLSGSPDAVLPLAAVASVIVWAENGKQTLAALRKAAAGRMAAVRPEFDAEALAMLVGETRNGMAALKAAAEKEKAAAAEAAEAEGAVGEADAAAASPVDAPAAAPAAAPKAFSTTYRCKKCRNLLFTDVDVMEHEVGDGQESFRWHKRDGGGHTTADTGVESCTSHFINEALPWVRPAAVDNDGKLTCPHKRCGARIGSYAWFGSQCSCGAWVVPSLQVSKAKVDKGVR